MIEIDGSAGEGGGQVVRASLTLAMSTASSIKIRNVRALGSNPGLRAQHLAAVHAAAAICGARIGGLGSPPRCSASSRESYALATMGSMSALRAARCSSCKRSSRRCRSAALPLTSCYGRHAQSSRSDLRIHPTCRWRGSLSACAQRYVETAIARRP